MQRKMKKSKGFTLIEVLIVLGLIAVGMMLIISNRATANLQTSVNKELSNLSVLSGCINKIYSTSPTGYASLDNNVAKGNGCVPKVMANTGSNIRHSWNSTGVTIGTANSNANYTITYASVPKEACSSIVAQTYVSYESVTVNGTAITSVAQASSTCGNSNTIVWTGI